MLFLPEIENRKIGFCGYAGLGDKDLLYSIQNSFRISLKTNGHTQYNGLLISYVTRKITYLLRN